MSPSLQHKTDIFAHVGTLVEEACQQDENIYGYDMWTYHIVSVVQYGRQLAEQLGADVEIVHLAALLHDYAGIKNEDWVSEHHVYGAQLAGDILQELEYPQERIQAVQHCILSHRASKDVPRETLEAEIVASADAMAHFACVPSLLHLTFVQKGMTVETGTQWVLDKLERSWNKLMPQAQVYLQEQYDSIKMVLSSPPTN